MLNKQADDLDLKDATTILARVIERTENVRDAVKRRAAIDGVDASFLVLGAEQEIAALNLAMATLLLARGKIEEAADAMGVVPLPPAPPSAPKPAPVAPWPHGAEVEPPPNGYTGQLPRLRPLQRNVPFRPGPVSPRMRAPSPEITF